MSPESGFFNFGQDTICYGRSALHSLTAHPTDRLQDAAKHAGAEGAILRLPFDPTNVIDNLRMERYMSSAGQNGFRRAAGKLLHHAYYAVRPLMPVAFRRHFQRYHLRDRRRMPFPSWPVDRTVEQILERFLLLSMKAQGAREIPFVWFWPEGAPGCALMTHDIETEAGLDFCPHLMDIDDAFGVKAAFQIVPEERYAVPDGFAKLILARGFEVCVQDLNHDGHLYSDRDEFLRRAQLINHYGKKYGAQGFRAAVLYRNLDWYSALDFRYDMSVPNAAHLEAQAGGCCTLFPYFIGQILELPVTTTQDYSLFHILGEYSIEHWKNQICLIFEKHGLASFIVHPDYIVEEREQGIYKELLAYLAKLRKEQNIWIALPREIDEWWRARGQMQLVSAAGTWRIEGPQSERARVAYARIEEDHLVYRVEDNP